MDLTDKLSDLELLENDWENIQDIYVRGIIWRLMYERKNVLKKNENQ